MEQYKDNFVEESLELLSELEKVLLMIEVTPHDQSLIQQVFRALHTLKGNSSMFGFTAVADFTHYLESVYEYIRNGQQQMNKPILNVTLAAVDHLFTLINNLDNSSIVNGEVHAGLNQKIADLLKGMGKAPEIALAPTAQNTELSDGLNTYVIHFEPHEKLFYNGTNPIALLAELQALGSCSITCNTANIPTLEDINPTYCYTSWDVTLQTEVKIEVIKQVFVFVTGLCSLSIEKVQPAQLNAGNAKVEPAIFPNLKDQPVLSSGASAERNSVISSIRVPSEKLDTLMGLVSELITLQAKLGTVAGQSLKTELLNVSESFEKILTNLRDNAFSLCLVPVKTMLTPFNRLVRDLAEQLNKEIEFITEGVETELDKNIIEGLSDPLMHLLRNSIDHGIEDQETRLKLGKRKQGRIVFKAYCAGANVYIEIQDDGKGIDPEKIKSKAIEKGLISKDEILTEAEIFNLIFLPGFSTAEQVSAISGRGVGMDVVKRKIEDIRGQIKITSVVNSGTTTIIKLPITVSIIDGLLVQINNDSYVIPLAAVERCLEAPAARQISRFNKVLVLDGQQVPYIDLADEFGGISSDELLHEIVLVYFEEKRIALMVDRVLGKFQAVLKPLGRHYQKIENISGATILGDGNIALVLDTNKVAEHYLNKKRLANVS